MYKLKPLNILIVAVIFFILFKVASEMAEKKYDALKQIKTYAEIASKNYYDSYVKALELQNSIQNLLDAPSKDALEKARASWKIARDYYNQTEVFRFYNGPIDFSDSSVKEQGPENRINAWPANEAYIDYTRDNPNSGVIMDKISKISKDFLNEKHSKTNVILGFHSIEFLLWGQDFRRVLAGNRPYTDYIAGNFFNNKRRDFLKITTELLVQDLHTVAEAWNTQKDNNYYSEFIKLKQKQALSNIFTGVVSLSGNEISYKKILDLIEVEKNIVKKEPSDYSDYSIEDLLANFQGIKNIYFGEYKAVEKTFTGNGIGELVKNKSPALNKKILGKIKEIDALAKTLPKPFDEKVLKSPKGSVERVLMAKFAESFIELSDYIKNAGTDLGLEVEVRKK
ncbi:MAG: imelysin family protein [Alphaproteobacteria bacterium]